MTNYIATMENITEQHELITRWQESENLFRSVLSVISEGLAVISADGVWMYANPVAEEILGQPPGALVGLTPLDLKIDRLRSDGSICPPEEYATYRVLRDGKPIWNTELGFRYPDGHIRWCKINCSPLGFDENGKATGAVITYLDITEHRRAEARLRLAQAAIRGSGETILLVGAGQIIESVNPAFEQLTGFSSDEVVGKEISLLDSTVEGERIGDVSMQVLAETGHWQGKLMLRCKSEMLCPVWLGVSVVKEEGRLNEHYIYIISDMTERAEVQRRIEFLAHHDSLTGLPNRLLLRDRIEQALVRAGRMNSCLALLFLDIDHFKNVNDSFGHSAGDALLKEVAERLKACVRDSDTISRQGGDEFVILLNDVRHSEAVAHVAETIRQCIAEPLLLGGQSFNPSLSMGIALYPDDAKDFDLLMQKADAAMYCAKQAGRNGYRFFSEQKGLPRAETPSMDYARRVRPVRHEAHQPELDLGAPEVSQGVPDGGAPGIAR